MKDRGQLETLFRKNGADDFTWIVPGEIVTGQWVRMKCTFGCGNYGRHACCPPHMPSVAECRQVFDEYEEGVIFHFPVAIENPDDRRAWSKKTNQHLLDLERDVFLEGYQKVFLLPASSCALCDECAGTKNDCRNPASARPTPEGMAIDVYSTVRKYDLPIHVLTDRAQTVNRYAFLLIE
jgi:predicted metal-binding protein